MFSRRITFVLLIASFFAFSCRQRDSESSWLHGQSSNVGALDQYVEEAFRTNHHYMKVLDDGDDALRARIYLFRNARRQIDIQTFIWDDDETGRYFFYELLRAAHRGVRVRILVDALLGLKNAEFISFVQQHYSPQIEIRYYNPTANRITPNFLQKLLTLFTNFRDTNQRMHSKVVAVDNAIAIVGGRNVQNAYFERSAGLNFRDRDALVIGPQAAVATQYFEEFWNFERSIPASEMKEVKRYSQYGTTHSWTKRADFKLETMFDDIDGDLGDSAFMTDQLAHKLVSVEKLEFWSDLPGKNSSHGLHGGGRISEKLNSLIGSARSSLLIQSPYFVLSDSAKDLLASLPETTEIKISTNSLVNSDMWISYAATFKQRRFSLSLDRLSLHEFMPFPAELRTVAPRYDLNREYHRSHRTRSESSPVQLGDIPNSLGNDPYLCIHAKGIVVDDRYAVIGSYNLDPRSENLNTETGVITSDPTIVRQLRHLIERDMSGNNSWVIGTKYRPFGVREVENTFGNIFEAFPIDLWLLSSSSSFELVPGGEQVAPHSSGFYDNYSDLGLFPMLSPLHKKSIMIHMSKVWIETVIPIL